MRRLLLLIAGALILMGIAIPIAAVYYLAFTPEGFQLIVSRIPHKVGSFEIEVTDAGGSVARGIRVGNLEPHERITRILKSGLEARYQQEFVTERWGRGVFWQWIGFLTRANRSAKPKSSHVSFGCSKFFIMVDTDGRRFECGLQIERGYVRAPREMRECQLRSDWDWQRLVAGLTPRALLMRELKRLTDDEFEIQAGSWSEPHVFRKATLPSSCSGLTKRG